MKKNYAKRVLSLVLSLAMLIGMMSVLTVFGVSADSETTIFSGLNADDWDYTAVDGVFYFDSGKLYNNCSATTAAGRAITSKETLNLGKQFTASYVLGAKAATSNYPTEVDYGIAFRVGESLEVLVYHDSKWGTCYNEVTNTTKSIPKAKITYNGAVIYDGVAVKRDDGTTKLAAGINNSMTKGTYTVHYENGVLSLVYTLWKVPYEYLYTTAEDGSKTYGINLADLVPDFDASQVIFNDKVSVSLICATAKDVMSLNSFSLSSVPAAPPSAVTNFTVASSNEEYGIVLADENNPVEIVAGDRLTYTAVANEGYRFAGWFNAAGTALAGTPTATFPIYEGTEIYAYFVSSADHTQVAKPNRATILCLGDSITDGYCIASGYRSYLMKQLYAEGAYFDFSAGKYRDDDDVRLPVGYRNHGGLSGVGFKAYGSLKTAITYLDDSMGVANADIALVMLGTNDYSHYADASDYIGEYYRAYIDKLYEQNPNIAVFVASVINQKTMATPAAAAGALNEQLPAIVAEYKAAGKDITFVDMCNLSGLESSNFADAVHPNESGAEKIANVWYNAIVDKVFEINALGDNSYKAPDAVESVTVLGGDTINVYMQSKNRVQLLTYVTPATAEMTTVTWNSSDDSIAAVDTFGTVTALREGTVTVTATTIDGNVTDSITLNVINSDEPDANTVLFSDNFSTADNWTGDTGIINTGANNIFANYANATKTISTVDTFLADQFRLHFVYGVYGNNIANYSGKYTEVSFGGYALRFGDCARTIDVYKNGVKLANIVTIAANTAATEYDMIYNAGTLYIAINSVIIAQITDVSAPVESNITVVANEPWRASYISNLYLTGTAVCHHNNLEVRGDVTATCTTDGNTGEVWCLDCGTKIVESEVIPALGHTEETIPGKAATCGSDGLTDGVKCSVCGEILVEQEVITATGEHTYGDWVINEEAGTQTKTCTVCGATVTEEYIPPVTDIEGNWNADGSVTWALAADGTLTVSGTGAMDNSKVGRSPVQEYADRIKAVVIGDGITQIGSRAFRDMVNIESVTFGKDVTFINYEAFYGCTSLTTVSLNEGITQISSLVFSNTAIASIELPSTLTKLDARVFKGCANLDNVVIPDSVTYTGYELFMNCTSLTTFKWSAGCDWFNSLTFGGCTSLTKITVPKTVQHIKSSTFANCTALEEIDFEDSDTLFHVSSALPAIASTAFSGCSSTMVVKAWSGSAVENVAKAAGVTFQAKNDAPFKFVVNEDGVSCTVTGLRTNGATPTIPTTINGYTVTAIGDYAFRNNTTMTGINIAGTVETIGQGAFQNTKISTTVHIPESVKTIGVNAFADCAELTGVTFYGGVTDIQSGAFANCPKLSSLRRFQNLNTTIARNAFLNCTSLTSVQIGAGATLNGNVFSGCVDTLTIKCTEGSSAYEYAVAKGFAYELI